MYNPKTYWDEIGQQSAPGIGDSSGKFGSNKKGNSLYKLSPWSKLPPFLEYLEEGQQVLDLGSGIGICVGKLTGLGFKAVGCDISPMLLDVARKNCISHGISNPMFVQWDGYKLPFQSESFDRVIANAVLQHVTEEAAVKTFFFETNRILRLRGQLIICQSVCSRTVKPVPNAILRPPKTYELLAAENGFALKTMKRVISSFALMKVVYKLLNHSVHWKEEPVKNNNKNMKPKLFHEVEWCCTKPGFYLSKIIDPIINFLGCHFLTTQVTMVFEKNE